MATVSQKMWIEVVRCPACTWFSARMSPGVEQLPYWGNQVLVRHFELAHPGHFAPLADTQVFLLDGLTERPGRARADMASS